jgi:hypothetical protein
MYILGITKLTHEPKPGPAMCVCVLYVPRSETNFYTFKWLEKIQKNNISWHAKVG